VTVSDRWFRLDRHDDPTDPAPEPDPTTDPQPEPTPTGQDPTVPVDVNALPPNVRKLIADLRRENGSHRQGRTAAEQAAAEAQQQRDAVLKALGINADGSEVEDPQARVTELAERAERAEAYAWTIGVKSNVYDLAASTGANPKLVFNSNEFRDTLDDLVAADPGSPEFRSALEQKMRDFVAANPEYASAAPSTTAAPPPGPRPDRSQGRGSSAEPVDFRKADRAAVDAELAKYGFRQRS
jgi:hypothetical protein